MTSIRSQIYKRLMQSIGVIAAVIVSIVGLIIGLTMVYWFYRLFFPELVNWITS